MELSYQNKWYTQPQASTSHVRSFEKFSLKRKKKGYKIAFKNIC